MMDGWYGTMARQEGIQMVTSAWNGSKRYKPDTIIKSTRLFIYSCIHSKSSDLKSHEFVVTELNVYETRRYVCSMFRQYFNT